jgi:transposase/5-methylcytosine-specific restriction endonuclease McrA
VFVDRKVLAGFLAEGLSLAEIGRRVGRDHSTVGYWLKKHRLVANGYAKHAPRGGIPRARLAALVERGLTRAQIASELGCSTSTVDHWLRRHSLATVRARQSFVPAADGEAIGRCRTHGRTAFVREGRGYYRCKACRKQRVVEWRQRAKRRLVAEGGGRCRLCGYDRYPGALHFHHLDPATKEFALSVRGLTKSIARLREEASKCVLLCSNCHAEVEGGIVSLPQPP